MLDKALTKVGNFSYRFRYLVLTVAVLLFVGVSVLQAFAGVSYSYSDYNKVTEIFPEDDTLVIVYDNKDEGKIMALADELAKNEHVTSINAYATTLGLEMNTAELAATAGIDESFIKTLFYIKANGTQTAGLTFPVFLNFVASDVLLSNEMFADKIDDATKEQLLQTKDMVNSIATGTAYDAGTLAAMFGMDAQTVGGIFYMAGAQTMTLEGFVDTMLGMAAQNPNAAAQEQLAQLQQMKGLCTLVKSNQPLSPAELVAVFPVQSEMFNEGTVSLLYLMFHANTADMSGETLALYDFFGFIANDILTNDMFAPYFDEATKAQMTEAKATMDDGKAQLVGEKHSRMILTLDYELESKEMYDFYADLETKLDDSFEGEYNLVGNSAMSNELSKTFKNEHLMISIITAVAIFLVVLLTFRKFSIPLILVCIIECAVFITMSAMTIANVSMYFIALIIVQCVLMGSMVDYGILLTNYYVEVREEKTKEEALPEVLKRSVRAISISAIILITITFICGLLMNGAVASILLTLCIGSFSALLLVIFVLPSLLAIFDKTIVKKKKA